MNLIFIIENEEPEILQNILSIISDNENLTITFNDGSTSTYPKDEISCGIIF